MICLYFLFCIHVAIYIYLFINILFYQITEINQIIYIFILILVIMYLLIKITRKKQLYKIDNNDLHNYYAYKQHSVKYGFNTVTE